VTNFDGMKRWTAIVFAVSSLSFTTAFAITTVARAVMQRSFAAGLPPPPVERPKPFPGRWVFQDQSQSLQAKNALLIQRALVVQSRQGQQSGSPEFVSGNANRQSSLPPLQENEFFYFPAPLPSIMVRVSIAHSASISIGASDEFSVTNEDGQILENFPAMQAIQFSAVGDGLQFDLTQSSRPVWVRPTADDALVFVGDRWYRGSVQVIPQNDSLMIVNHVDLDQYLYSVVGAEMPSNWHSEALKAQAIAARSYALTHIYRPHSNWYDVTNTQRHQVYAGVATESDASYAAVAATAGFVLLGKEGEIFEAMYAATDAVVDRYHQGFRSMSQVGAEQKAQAGLNYHNILSDYYPETFLGVLAP
jgi:hypothetical protein